VGIALHLLEIGNAAGNVGIGIGGDQRQRRRSIPGTAWTAWSPARRRRACDRQRRQPRFGLPSPPGEGRHRVRV